MKNAVANQLKFIRKYFFTFNKLNNKYQWKTKLKSMIKRDNNNNKIKFVQYNKI